MEPVTECPMLPLIDPVIVGMNPSRDAICSSNPLSRTRTIAPGIIDAAVETKLVADACGRHKYPSSCSTSSRCMCRAWLSNGSSRAKLPPLRTIYIKLSRPHREMVSPKRTHSLLKECS